jgi:hypothetical protein
MTANETASFPDLSVERNRQKRQNCLGSFFVSLSVSHWENCPEILIRLRLLQGKTLTRDQKVPRCLCRFDVEVTCRHAKVNTLDCQRDSDPRTRHSRCCTVTVSKEILRTLFPALLPLFLVELADTALVRRLSIV